MRLSAARMAGCDTEESEKESRSSTWMFDSDLLNNALGISDFAPRKRLARITSELSRENIKNGPILIQCVHTELERAGLPQCSLLSKVIQDCVRMKRLAL